MNLSEVELEVSKRKLQRWLRKPLWKWGTDGREYSLPSFNPSFTLQCSSYHQPGNQNLGLWLKHTMNRKDIHTLSLLPWSPKCTTVRSQGCCGICLTFWRKPQYSPPVEHHGNYKLELSGSVLMLNCIIVFSMTHYLCEAGLSITMLINSR